MKIALAQINAAVGDIKGNVKKIKDIAKKNNTCDLIVFPELALIGGPPRDLVLIPEISDSLHAHIAELKEFSKSIPGCGLLIGAPLKGTGRAKGLTNAAILIYGGRILASVGKTRAAMMTAWAEQNYFTPAAKSATVRFKGKQLNLSVGDSDFYKNAKADILINIAAVPFSVKAHVKRISKLIRYAKQSKTPVIAVNAVGGNDELIFAGASLALNDKGDYWAACHTFQEDIKIMDTNQKKTMTPKSINNRELVYDALCLGVRDYVHKSGFKSVVLGLSGGIDSAVVCCIAVQALGAENVLGLAMPSPYSSPQSVTDAQALAEQLGIRFEIVPISMILKSYQNQLQKTMGPVKTLTEENLQSRIRGTILMGYSNQCNSLVLATGNKSEASVGYCTLYGDMCGALCVLADLTKTAVYHVAETINTRQALIPQAIITKAPSAELRPNQTDQDTLPPYPVLDQIIARMVEGHASRESLIQEGLNAEAVEFTADAFYKSEFKREQAAPGLKIFTHTPSTKRRLPIAMRLRY